jgi:SAM-dependent methyltransferase
MKGRSTLSVADPQFQLSHEYYLKGLDFTDWYRYYFIINYIIQYKPQRVLEIGVGNRIVERCLEDSVNEYMTMDLNPNLSPDILSDLREFQPDLQNKFDMIICSEVLEHMPFQDLKGNLDNIRRYLTTGGKAIITLPHRQRSFLFISPSYRHFLFALPIWTTPIGFYLRFFKKKVVRDPNHLWEIGDLVVKKNDVESLIKDAGFRIDKFMDLLYVDFWLLEKLE